MPELNESIEKSIRSRDIPKSAHLIRKLLRSQSKEAETNLQAAKYFLRIGDFQSALRLMNLDKPKPWSKMRGHEREEEIFIVRVLNTLGASETALRFIDRLPLSAKEKFKEHLFPIYFHNYLDELALPTLIKSQSKADSELTYAEHISLICAAESYFELGKITEAKDLLKRIERITTECLPRVRIHLVLGQIALKNKDLNEAKARLHSSLEYLNSLSNPQKDNPKTWSMDHGNLFIALAQYHAHTGEFALARDYIENALKILYVGNYKPENWLHVLFVRGFIEYQEFKKFPKDWEYLLTYPSPRNQFKNMMKEYSELPKKILISKKESSTFIEYDLHFEVKITHKENKTHTQLGFDLVDRAAITLLLCGEYGVSQFRFYETLWPNEYFSTKQCTQRMGQLVTRLRRQGFKVIWKNMHLKLDGAPSSEIHWSESRGPKGGRFLEKHSRFFREDLQKFFAISKSSALNQIAEWLKGGHIRIDKLSGKPEYVYLPQKT